MAGDWFTIAEIAQQAQIPENSARRYAQTFSAFLPTKVWGRVKKYTPDAVGILMHVAALYQDGASTPEIRERLQQEYPQTIVSTKESESSRVPTTMPSPLMILSTVTRIAEKIDEQRQEIVTLRREVESLREQHEEMTTLRMEIKAWRQQQEQRDQWVVSEMRTILEEKMISDQHANKSWWQRVFGRKS